LTVSWRRARLYVAVALLRAVADLPVVWLLLFLQSPSEGSGGIGAVAFNATLFVAFATIHSALARDRSKDLVARLVGANYSRPAYVAIAGLTLSFLLYLWRPVAGTFWHTTGGAYWVLSFLFLTAVAGLFYAATFIDYVQFLGVRSLLRAARGQPPKLAAFSAEGPYAHCRHPMYSFLLIAFWVGPVMTSGRAEFAALGTVYLLVGTALEERNLRQELGAIYDLYAANVPMWIPRLSPWIPQKGVTHTAASDGWGRSADGVAIK
jgi:protein-S-isoprenylcysteine O-methyltransferase Ste14